MIWQDDVDLDAAHRRHVERLADRVIGQEIRRHDPHGLLRGRECPDEHELDPADVRIVRSVADAAGERRAGERGVGHPGAGGPAVGRHGHERLAGRERPVLHEHLEQLRHHGAAEFEVHVAHRVPRLVREPAAIADVEPAGEADRAVHDENLAVVAQVGVGKVDRHARGQEPLGSHALRGQDAEDRGKRVARADAVDEHAHLDAPLHRPAERLGEDPSRGVVVEDVRRQPDAAPGPVDRREHPRIGRVAAIEQLDRVAVDERPIGDLSDERRQRAERRLLRPDGLLESRCLRNRVAEFVGDGAGPGAQLGGPGADAVDAEHRIGDRPEDRRQPDQAHPADRRARVALHEDRVRRREDVDREDRRGEHVRPKHEPPPPHR